MRTKSYLLIAGFMALVGACVLFGGSAEAAQAFASSLDRDHVPLMLMGGLFTQHLIAPETTKGVFTRLRRALTRDAMMTFDQRTIDSTGAFLIGELERLDPTMHEPLVDYTWSRDINLREDVSIADEMTSFTNSTFAAVGGVNPTGKSWIGKDSNTISGIALDIGKTSNPLFLWGMEISYTIPELESAQKLGRPVDSQKLEGLHLKHQMDTDEQVYIGDATLGYGGLVNSALVTAANVAAGAAGTTTWATKTHDEILADVNTFLNAAWAASGWTIVPSKLLLPPLQFAMLVSRKVSEAGNMSILQYLKDNSLCMAKNGKPLDIQPLKWLVGRGTNGTDRMVCYTQDSKRVRFPMVPLQRTPLEYRSIFHLTTYFGRLGVVEFVYPETLRYADGI